MSLRQLAGPFALVDDTAAPLSGTGINPDFSGYYPGYGLLMLADTFDVGFTCRVSIDGVVENLGLYAESWVWDAVNQVLVINNNLTEKIALGYSPYLNFSGVPAWFGTLSLVAYTNAVILANRILTVNGGDIVAYNGATTASEFTLTSWGGNSSGYIGPGRTPYEVFVSMRNGSGSSDLICAFYDTVNKVLTTPYFHLGVGAQVAWYDQLDGVIISLNDSPSWGLTIWSLDIVPATLSAVTLQSGATAPGSVAVYQTQLLGSFDEPISNYLVEWAILSGSGMLLDTQTTTNATGVATCRVLYPLSSTGTSEIGASVIC